MVVQRLWTPAVSAEVTGRGYGTAGADRPVRCDARADGTGGSGACCGTRCCATTPTSAAPTAATGASSATPSRRRCWWRRPRTAITAPALRTAWPRVGEEPFDSRRRRMTTLHRRAGRAPRWLTICKGAPETVLGLVPDSPAAREALAAAQALAAQGFRVLALADVERDAAPGPGALERDLELVGLAAVADPPREAAADVVEACRRAGIRVVLITGDHPATARAVAGELGLGGAEAPVADGDMVARGEHVAEVDRIDVYARIRPEQKVDVLTALQDRGHVVAMTGDGVNDAPALRRADIGVAMGGRGTEVARQAADLVLADDDLGTIVLAVAEGRRIYSNIRTFLRYGLSGRPRGGPRPAGRPVPRPARRRSPRDRSCGSTCSRTASRGWRSAASRWTRP